MPNFWWVNQGESYLHESSLGLLWAPLLSGGKRPSRPSHWESMNDVQVGDVVFHYSFQALVAVSEVLLPARLATRPYASAVWSEEGREVRTRYSELPSRVPLVSIPLTERIAESRNFNSPFSSSGTVVVGYLRPLTTEFALLLASQLDLLASASDSFVDFPDDLPPDEDVSIAIVVGPTDGLAKVKYRLEQPALVEALFGRAEQMACALCGRVFPVSYLHAAHIKKRSKCTENERWDPNVVMAACVLGCDALFESGQIFVDAQGMVRANAALPTTPALDESMYLPDAPVSAFRPAAAKYFRWHRRNIAGQRV